MEYRIIKKAGRLANGSERGQGSVFHAVPKNEWVALCGAKPGRLSHWSNWESDTVTCKRCLKKIERYYHASN